MLSTMIFPPLGGGFSTAGRRVRSPPPEQHRSMQCGRPDDANARSTGAPRGKQAASLVELSSSEVGLQQSELDQVVLCAAAADAFVLTGEGFERIDCR